MGGEWEGGRGVGGWENGKEGEGREGEEERERGEFMEGMILQLVLSVFAP